MNPQEPELGQEVTEEADAPPRHRHARNHHNQERRYRRCEAAGGEGSVARGPQREEQDPAEPHLPPQPIPRPAVTRYRRQGDSEARIRAQQQRHRQRQQREAELAQQQHQLQQQAEMTPDDERERDDSALARSASTESGFHTHTDRAEGDDGLLVMSLEPERQPEAEDEAGNYGVQLRPEAEGYTESAEAEQQHLRPSTPPTPQGQDEHVMNTGYSNYVYAEPLGHPEGPGDEPYSEPYDIYSLSEHVYEEICDVTATAASDRAEDSESSQRERMRAGFQLLEGGGVGDFHQQEAVGSRLRHYDERSDGESDSPEKEAEFAPYPRADSCDQEEDPDAPGNKGTEEPSSSLHHPVGDTIYEENEGLHEADKGSVLALVAAAEGSPSEDSAAIRNSQEKRDAISLAIKDIKEAIEEVKNRAVRSPYTPDEPKEPIWVMRTDLSPSTECDLQSTVGCDVSTAPRETIHCCCGLVSGLNPLC